MLAAGGATAVPRWTLDPVPGVGEHEVAVPDDLAAALRRLADELGVPLSSVLLAAHAKVLAALSGERDVVDRLRRRGGRRPLPCRLTTEPGIVAGAAAARAPGRVASCSRTPDFPVDDLRRELGWPGRRSRPCSTRPATAATSPADAVLRVGVRRPRRRLALRLRYRTDVLDARLRRADRRLPPHRARAARRRPGRRARRAEPALRRGARASSSTGSPGPHRELPDRRFHELFEERVRPHPDAVAAVHGDRQWTYRELNARANRLGRALLARGLRREGVVAVVTERNLDWMAAVLAVFKAGGVYLPIEPHFPADRIATTLSRAGCRLVLTEPGSTTTLDQALDSLPGRADGCSSTTAYAEDHADGDLGVAVGAGPARLHLLHLRLHRRAQGRDVRARGHAQPPLRQDRRPGDRRGPGRRPDRAPVLRHLAVAAGVRRCWSAAGPCSSSRR